MATFTQVFCTEENHLPNCYNLGWTYIFNVENWIVSSIGLNILNVNALFSVILGHFVWKIKDYFHTEAIPTKVIRSGRNLSNAFK